MEYTQNVAMSSRNNKQIRRKYIPFEFEAFDLDVWEKRFELKVHLL